MKFSIQSLRVAFLILVIPFVMAGTPVKIRTNDLFTGGQNKSAAHNGNRQHTPVYRVGKLATALKIDANWDKVQWKHSRSVDLKHFMGEIPPFRPAAQAKMMYDDSNLYIIFRVHDRFVRSLVRNYNGPVSGDACVEFFFCPDTAFRNRYFNVETNAGGTILMAYHVFGQKQYQKFSAEELDQIEIAHSLPADIDPEITDPVTWTLEYRLPLALLRKYTSVVQPRPGVTWRANFYKTSSKSSNPHWITWAEVRSPKPNFHLPDFFGLIRFQ